MTKDRSLQISKLNDELQDVIENASKERLTRAARLLGMYLALYKHHFGELSPEEYRELNSHVAMQDELGQSIYIEGMHELLDMVSLVEHHDRDPDWNHRPGAPLN